MKNLLFRKIIPLVYIYDLLLKKRFSMRDEKIMLSFLVNNGLLAKEAILDV